MNILNGKGIKRMNFYLIFNTNTHTCVFIFLHDRVNPFPKFLCIKGIVFLTFWQGIAISLLVHYLDLQVNTSSYDNTESEDTSIILQNLLISCEMFLFAIAHYCYYPWYVI